MRTNISSVLRLSIGLLCFWVLSPAAMAQATRTWVSGVGDDVNPCSRTAPCKTFAGAISKTASGGEISVLDPGGFGALTITKSITIDGGDGQAASVLGSLINGVIVNAAATDTVILRNLQINGAGNNTANSGLSGVKILNAKQVYLDQLRINGFTTGVEVVPSGSGNINVMLENSQVVNNTTGIKADSSKAQMRISNNTVTQNQTGLSATNGASITSFNNNRLLGNTTDGAPTLTVYPR
ncbi:NosD domain-containing protein [Ottowia thiooxydans]|uniref:Right handed beta helix domain-containing protein n=1 Tax=Ottowia thiooxydans TaxID=219182 RepID=A0ABV2Q5Z5_9BURK